ncbi:hypothetical protein [Pyrococcus abyssi]|uniref:hypothetical protein n=1 Tax=Pyrococcus abyssi TaxID=29292 RepID=UPI000A7FC99C|nr:hypothetical protein [Pyrococcus abyssi]
MDVRDIVGILILLGISLWIVFATIVERRSRKKAEEFFNSIRVERDRILLPGARKVKRKK